MQQAVSCECRETITTRRKVEVKGLTGHCLSTSTSTCRESSAEKRGVDPKRNSINRETAWREEEEEEEEAQGRISGLVVVVVVVGV
jgi:hypothetical protein